MVDRIGSDYHELSGRAKICLPCLVFFRPLVHQRLMVAANQRLANAARLRFASCRPQASSSKRRARLKGQLDAELDVTGQRARIIAGTLNCDGTDVAMRLPIADGGERRLQWRKNTVRSRLRQQPTAGNAEQRTL